LTFAELTTKHKSTDVSEPSRTIALNRGNRSFSHMHTTAGFETTAGWIAPALIACAYILLNSFISEPNRKSFNAIMVAGAGAAYLRGGGFGVWEVVFCALMVPVAFIGLRSYRFIGIGWLLRSGWDILHHLHGNPLLPFSATSSLGCAICDVILALWFFAGAPSIVEVTRRQRLESTRSSS
jgi:hypothetical protein